MLPTVNDFDKWLEGEEALADRIRAAERATELLRDLSERAGRARCLALLELYESLPSGSSRYHEIAVRTGISISRVQQLLADGRVWRQHDQLVAAAATDG